MKQRRATDAMKRALFAAVLVVGGVLIHAEIVQAEGFVRLSEFVERYGFSVRYDLISGRRVLTAGGTRLIVCPGMRQVVVGTQSLTLGHAVVCAGGDLLIESEGAREIAALLGAPTKGTNRVPDAQVVASQARSVKPLTRARFTVRPVVARLPAKRRATIVIDAGHGGKFTGARARSGLCEKDVNLAVALAVKRLLEQAGHRVEMTRTKDRSLSPNLNADLDARVALANGARADVFVSIHANHAGDRAVHGYEIYHFRGSAEGKRFAETIRQAFRRRIRDVDRGVKGAGFRVIKRARMPAVLIELGFMSNTSSAQRLAQPAYQRRLAAAIAEGIERYLEQKGSGEAAR